MTIQQLRQILDQIQIFDRTFEAIHLKDEFLLFRVTYNEPDIDTGVIERQCSRWWPIADDATETDIVETAFLAVMRSYDHVVKEHFLYRGRRVYSPHFSIEARIEMCDSQKA